MSNGKIKITLKRSLIGGSPKQKATVEALGLRKLNMSVVHQDNPQIRGMINKIPHLLTIEQV